MELPFSLQDAAKASRQILSLLDDIAKRGGKVVKFYQGRQRKKAARRLDYLRFHEGGMVNPLRKIASGDFMRDDIDALRKELYATAEFVGEAIGTLRSYRNSIREQLSIESAILLEEIIDGEDGKNNIRQFLHTIAGVPFDAHDGRRKEYIQGAAIRVLRKIDIMNKNIIDLHNSLLAGKKVAKRRVRAKKAASSRKSVPKRRAKS